MLPVLNRVILLNQELTQVFGRKKENDVHNNGFELSKVNQCPKFRAFIYEMLRIACALPQGIAHSHPKDLRCIKYQYKNDKGVFITDILCDDIDSPIWQSDKISNILNDKNNFKIEYDYCLPKNSLFTSNLGYLLKHKENVWKNSTDDPDLPCLENWLKEEKVNSNVESLATSTLSSSEGTRRIFVNNKKSIPFSVGKRDCLGQALAVKELYAFFGSLLLNYQIFPANKQHDPNKMDMRFKFGGFGLVIEPQIPVNIRKRE